MCKASVSLAGEEEKLAWNQRSTRGFAGMEPSTADVPSPCLLPMLAQQHRSITFSFSGG